MKNISLGHCDTLDYNPCKNGGLPTASLNLRKIPLETEAGRIRFFNLIDIFVNLEKIKNCVEKSD